MKVYTIVAEPSGILVPVFISADYQQILEEFNTHEADCPYGLYEFEIEDGKKTFNVFDYKLKPIYLKNHANSKSN